MQVAFGKPRQRIGRNGALAQNPARLMKINFLIR